MLLCLLIIVGCGKSQTTIPPSLPQGSPTIATARPALTPTKGVPMTAPSAADLEIVKTHALRCRTSATSSQFDTDYWVVWEVRNNRRDQAVAASSTGTMSIIGSQGMVLKTQTVEIVIPPDTVYYAPINLIEGKTVDTGGSKVESFRLDFTKLDWAPVDDSVTKYVYDVALMKHEMDSSVYPRHTFTVVVSNKSDFVMNYIRVLGLFLDTRGNLVDIAYTNTKFGDPLSNVPYGESRAFTASSLSQTGRCVGPRDPGGYVLRYWVTFSSVTGQRIARFFTVELK